LKPGAVGAVKVEAAKFKIVESAFEVEVVVVGVVGVELVKL
jgi:hypothetical protein